MKNLILKSLSVLHQDEAGQGLVEYKVVDYRPGCLRRCDRDEDTGQRYQQRIHWLGAAQFLRIRNRDNFLGLSALLCDNHHMRSTDKRNHYCKAVR